MQYVTPLTLNSILSAHPLLVAGLCELGLSCPPMNLTNVIIHKNSFHLTIQQLTGKHTQHIMAGICN